MPKVELLFRFAKIKLLALADWLWDWYNRKFREPDYSKKISQKAAIIETSIQRAETAWQLEACEIAIKTMLLPYGEIACMEVSRLYTMLWRKDGQIRKAAIDVDWVDTVIGNALNPTA